LQFKAILAAEIIKALDKEQLTVRAAHDRTGIAAADFSRIRNNLPPLQAGGAEGTC
jgi:hypothetical protein